MKRKIFSILFALVLVLSFSLVTAAPAGAATTYNVYPYTLQTGTNAASWSTVQKATGSYSVLLNYASGDNSYVEFTPATGTTVADLDDIADGWSWWYYASAAYGPILELRFSAPGDGHVDITVCTAEVSPTITTGTTEEVTSASTCIYFGNDDTNQTSFSNNTGSVTLAGVLASINAETAMLDDTETADAWELTRVRAEIGWSTPARTCYIDDIEIAGTTYYGKIQDAIDTAITGDTITAAAGTYTEDLLIPVGTDDLELAGASGATIKGVDIGAAFENFDIMIKASGAKIHGFTIQGPDPESGKLTGGLVIGTPNVEIYDNAFEVTNTNAWPSVGIEFSQAIQTWCKTMDPEVTGITTIDVDGLSIHDNTFTEHGTGTLGYEGIYINTDADTGSGTISIADNVFTGDIARAITVERSDATISGNTIITDLLPGVDWGAGAGQSWTGININDAGAEDQTTVTVTGNTIKGSGTGKGFREGIRIGRAGQILTLISVTQNTVQMNTAGIKIWDDGADGVVVNYNDISGNVTYGVWNTDNDNDTLDAKYNYWGDPSGPTVTSNARGTGDTVAATHVDYEPWLHTTQATVYPSGTRYYAYNWCDLTKGWNIWSTPIALDEQADTWKEYKELGNDLDLATGSNVYYVTSSGTWATPGDDYELSPCDALYIKMASAQNSPILFSPSTSVPSKTLVAGWNLISASYVDNMDSPTITNTTNVENALASVYNVPGANNLGYSIVVSPAVNQTAWTDVRGTNINITLYRKAMEPTKGYWVFMTNAGTLAGTVFTPVSPLLP